MAENLPQNPPQQDDLLETLLAGAAERAAKKEMDELAKKGTVTKSEFGTALSEFETRLLAAFDAKLGDRVQKGGKSEQDEEEDEGEPEAKPVQKAGRRATLSAPTDARSDNPVRYLVQKGRKNEEFDDQDKALIWALTFKGFTQGMSMQEIDGPDFGDDNQ